MAWRPQEIRDVRDQRFDTITAKHVVEVAAVEPYQPGAFYMRELPALTAVLAVGPSVCSSSTATSIWIRRVGRGLDHMHTRPSGCRSSESPNRPFVPRRMPSRSCEVAQRARSTSPPPVSKSTQRPSSCATWPVRFAYPTHFAASINSPDTAKRRKQRCNERPRPRRTSKPPPRDTDRAVMASGVSRARAVRQCGSRMNGTPRRSMQSERDSRPSRRPS
jgi:hypothetical protein